jgi:hypothetical protein
MLLPPVIRPLSEALGEELADEEGLAIMLLPPIICELFICELSIIVPSGIIC